VLFLLDVSRLFAVRVGGTKLDVASNSNFEEVLFDIQVSQRELLC
jgi:hypothetical protein